MEQFLHKELAIFRIPISGSILFLILYYIASLMYPGGSQANQNAKGFSWVHNYWCNLLSEQAISGDYNSARPIALTGMLVLCISISTFWYRMPPYLNVEKWIKNLIQISGICSMTAAFLLLTSLNHDFISYLAAFFGFLAFFATLYGLYINKRTNLLYFGLLTLVTAITNGYIYYTKEQILYLPVIQKIAFLLYLLWICMIELNIYRSNIPINEN